MEKGESIREIQDIIVLYICFICILPSSPVGIQSRIQHSTFLHFYYYLISILLALPALYSC